MTTTRTQADMAAHDKTTWELYTAACNAGAKAAQRASSVADYDAAQGTRYARSMTHWNIDKMRADAEAARLAEVAAKAKLDEHEQGYEGWSRFWCVPAGHIHSSRHCSTCNKMGKATAFYLAHEVSGMDEAAAVAAQGPVLCTTCFPTAPLAWTNGLDEAAKAKKAAQCGGQRDYDKPSRTGYYSGNWATCDTCGGRITITSTGKLRAHKAAKSDAPRR